MTVPNVHLQQIVVKSALKLTPFSYSIYRGENLALTQMGHDLGAGSVERWI